MLLRRVWQARAQSSTKIVRSRSRSGRARSVGATRSGYMSIFTTPSMAAGVRGDHAKAGGLQQAEPAGEFPVAAGVGREAVQQHDGVALAQVLVGDAQVSGVEKFHDSLTLCGERALARHVARKRALISTAATARWL